MFSQYREQTLFCTTTDWIVLALVDRRFYEAIHFTDLDDFLNLFDRIVGETEPLKLAIEKSVVHSLASLLEWRRSVRSMQIHDIHGVGV